MFALRRLGWNNGLGWAVLRWAAEEMETCMC